LYSRTEQPASRTGWEGCKTYSADRWLGTGQAGGPQTGTGRLRTRRGQKRTQQKVRRKRERATLRDGRAKSKKNSVEWRGQKRNSAANGEAGSLVFKTGASTNGEKHGGRGRQEEFQTHTRSSQRSATKKGAEKKRKKIPHLYSKNGRQTAEMSRGDEWEKRVGMEEKKKKRKHSVIRDF